MGAPQFFTIVTKIRDSFIFEWDPTWFNIKKLLVVSIQAKEAFGYLEEL